MKAFPELFAKGHSVTSQNTSVYRYLLIGLDTIEISVGITDIVINFASRQLFPQERTHVPNKKEAGWASFGEEIRNPNHPIVAWYPYQTGYPGSP